MLTPKYYLKRKLGENIIGLIPVVADPPFVKEEVNYPGIKEYKILKSQYSLREMSSHEERTKDQEETAIEIRRGVENSA